MAEHGPEWPNRLGDRLRVLLYESQPWRSGRVVDNLAKLLVMWHEHQYGSLALITTNYDNYIERGVEIVNQVRRTKGHSVLPTRVIFRGTTDDAGSKEALDRFEVSKDFLPIAHLHGYIPEELTSEDPILSEADYFNTSHRSAELLGKALGSTNCLIVGSSLVDPPLLNALLATRGPNKRYAMVPLQGRACVRAGPQATANFKKAMRLRLLHFQVEPIFPDYFFQVAQFLQEVVVCKESGTGSYTSHRSKVRYGQRLLNWWDAWLNSSEDSLPARQAADHEQLVETLKAIKGFLKPDITENLKIEVWLRWDPSARRELRLWASSVGTWLDVESMRSGEIDPLSEYTSIRAFCEGRPSLTSSSGKSRWKSYFAMPIWLEEYNWELPIGSVTLASMAGSEVLSQSNSAIIGRVVPLLQQAGRRIAKPNN